MHGSILRVFTTVAFLALCMGTTSTWAGNLDWGAAIGAMADSIAETARRESEKQRIIEIEREKMRIQWEYEKRRIDEENRRRLESERLARQREEERQRQLAAQKAKEVEEAKRTAISTGTGFFVSSKGYLITNFHVIEDKDTYAIRDVRGKFYRAEVIARDSKNDLALLKVDGSFPALKVADSNSVTKGQRVLAVGYPQISIQGNESKVTDGIISAFSGLRDNDDWFQISVPIQGGNSGGPLVTETGAVVGVVVATVSATKFLSKTGNIPQNVNFAIKSNLVREFLKSERVTNDATAMGKTSIDAVDKATVLVVAKNGQIDVAREGTARLAPPPDQKQPQADGLDGQQRQAQRSLAQRHPDWHSIANSADFKRWKAELPPADRNKLESTWDVNYISDKLDAYKASQNQQSNTRPPSTTQASYCKTSLDCPGQLWCNPAMRACVSN